MLGPPGEDGTNGSKGPTGDKGAPGADGRKGQPGSPGNDGAPGQPGRPGDGGKPGDAGRAGDKGPEGQAALPVNQEKLIYHEIESIRRVRPVPTAAIVRVRLKVRKENKVGNNAHFNRSFILYNNSCKNNEYKLLQRTRSTATKPCHTFDECIDCILNKIEADLQVAQSCKELF